METIIVIYSILILFLFFYKKIFFIVSYTITISHLEHIIHYTLITFEKTELAPLFIIGEPLGENYDKYRTAFVHNVMNSLSKHHKHFLFLYFSPDGLIKYLCYKFDNFLIKNNFLKKGEI